MQFSASLSAAALCFATVATSAPAEVWQKLTLIQQLQLAPTAVDRLKLLENDSDFVYDFNASTVGITKGLGGRTVKADRETFPALIGNGASMTVGFLGPCGFNTMHIHPRAAELNIVVQGRLQGAVTAENGARHIEHELRRFQMTVFPQGAMHAEFNPDCEEAIFVAAFPNEDPGVEQAVQTLMSFDDEIIGAALGGGDTISGADLEKYRKDIPENVALGVENCLKKCNISKR